MKFRTISVIGLGYIGLPTAALFAAQKIQVIGVDVNQKTTSIINDGKIHFIEPELDTIVSSVVHKGYLKATTQPMPAEAFIIAVPTPFTNGHKPDLKYIKSAAESIAPVLNKGNLVILESTCPVGATEQLADWLATERPDLTFPQLAGEDADINIAHCPERVLPGRILSELINNGRVIGGMSRKCAERAAELYQTFVTGECLITTVRIAEMAKLTENAFRDVNIAFANEISLICDDLDINVFELIDMANAHPRVNILQPGPGVGGHCIAVDPWFIVSKSPEIARLIHTAREVNDSKPFWVIEKIKSKVADLLNEHPDKRISDINIALLGITYKPDIDDLRESPSLFIAKELTSQMKCHYSIIEPNIEKLPTPLNGRAKLRNLEDGLSLADIVVLLVDHTPFKVEGVRYLLNSKAVIDTRGVWR